MTDLSPAQRLLIVAMCARAAECWAAGEERYAERWIAAALECLAGRDFVDLDADADR